MQTPVSQQVTGTEDMLICHYIANDPLFALQIVIKAYSVLFRIFLKRTCLRERNTLVGCHVYGVHTLSV